ncbi:thioesterase family protein [Streptomyces sp. HNM0574]|uniref:thioesterase family protein n=1 Tax=Streptomyces sp. HNM0574 TaxID=2714954 RepID=UPI00146ABDFD|nr:thioesterase family protein [Streptomyces sp. HNM0574]NLU66148.1 4-hydroxybenzoyl-CoA thioesterase [Streptomyces sp. HNM0574]
MAEHRTRVVTPYEGTGHRTWDETAPVPAPLELHSTPVRPEWTDYNGHLSESCYLRVFGDNSDAFFRYLGIGEEYRAAGGSLYTAETHLINRREAAEGEPLRLTLQLLDVDAKRVHLFHTMRHAADGTLLATAEQLLLHVDTAAGRAAPLPGPLRARLETVLAAHAVLPPPEEAGRRMGIPRNPAPRNR